MLREVLSHNYSAWVASFYRTIFDIFDIFLKVGLRRIIVLRSLSASPSMKKNLVGDVSRSSCTERFLLVSHVFARLELRSIGKSGSRFWNPDFGFCNRTRNPKTDFASDESVLRVVSIRKSKSGFHGFRFYHSIGKSENGFAKLIS